MKTKLLLPVMLLFVSFNFCLAQENNSKLLVKYSNDFLNKIKIENPKEYYKLNYFVEKGCYVQKMPDKPIETIDLKKVDPKTGYIIPDYQITEADLENFNPLEYNIYSSAQRNTYYKAGNTGYIIIVQSVEDIDMAVENYMRINNIKK